MDHYHLCAIILNLEFCFIRLFFFFFENLPVNKFVKMLLITFGLDIFFFNPSLKESSTLRRVFLFLFSSLVHKFLLQKTTIPFPKICWNLFSPLKYYPVFEWDIVYLYMRNYRKVVWEVRREIIMFSGHWKSLPKRVKTSIWTWIFNINIAFEFEYSFLY